MAPQLTIRPTIKPRERILAYGAGGSGKSQIGVSLIQAIPDAHFYVLDLDVTPSYERTLAYADVDHGNYTIEMPEPTSWPDPLEQVREWRAEATEDDWLIIDSFTPTWEGVREWYVNQMTKSEDLAEFLADVRRNTKTGKEYARAIMDAMNYDVINKEYNRLYTELRRWPGHVLLTCEQDAVRDDDARDVKALFHVGQKPKGQKKLIYVPATIIHMQRRRDGWTYTSIKDRGRATFEDEPIEDFARDYLIGVARWKRAVVKSG